MLQEVLVAAGRNKEILQFLKQAKTDELKSRHWLTSFTEATQTLGKSNRI
jgi:hypothetical protein